MGSEENVIRFVIGIFVSLGLFLFLNTKIPQLILLRRVGASFMDALGLNILKLDHVKEAKRDGDQQRGDCGRPLWHLGLYTYIASQLIGSTIALSMLLVEITNNK